MSVLTKNCKHKTILIVQENVLLFQQSQILSLIAWTPEEFVCAYEIAKKFQKLQFMSTSMFSDQLQTLQKYLHRKYNF